MSKFSQLEQKSLNFMVGIVILEKRKRCKVLCRLIEPIISSTRTLTTYNHMFYVYYLRQENGLSTVTKQHSQSKKKAAVRSISHCGYSIYQECCRQEKITESYQIQNKKKLRRVRT